VLFDLEGNRRSGIVMCHRICDMSIYGLSGLRKGDENSAYNVPLWSVVSFTILLGDMARKQ